MNYPFKTKPMQHQLDFWMKNRDSVYAASLMDMGTGKTKLLLDEIAYMYDKGWINGAIIFGNKGSYANIPGEIEIHLPNHINRLVALWRSPLNKKTISDIEALFHEKNKPLMKFLIMNIEALRSDKSFNLAYNFTKRFSVMGVIDESTHIKNHKALQTKRSFKIGSASTARRILTGSLVDNKPLDAWAQFEFLRPGNNLLGYKSFYSYKAHFCELQEIKVFSDKEKAEIREEKLKGIASNKVRGRLVKKVTGYKNLNELKQRIARYSVIIKKEDCLDLPPKVKLKRFVELTDDQKRYYKEMRKKSIIELKQESFCSAPIVLTKLLKLHQIVCGMVTDDEGIQHTINSNRISVLLDILDETDNKTIIWANYRTNILDINKQLINNFGQEKVAHYFGDTKENERAEVRKQFKRGNEGDLHYLIGNPTSGGYGLTLTAANLVIYFSNSFDAIIRNQSEDRCHRKGQEKKVTYIDLIAPETIDEKIYTALKEKKSISELLTPTNWEKFF